MRSNEIDDWYRILELPPGATHAEVREAYRVLSAVWHPDRFTGNARMQARATERQQRLNAAYERLVEAHRTHAATNTGATEAWRPARDPEVDIHASAHSRTTGPAEPKILPRAGRRLQAWFAWLTSTRRRTALVVGAAAVLAAVVTVAVRALSTSAVVVRATDGSIVLASDIAVGGGHACALEGARVACWGRDDMGQAGGEVATPDWRGLAEWRSLPAQGVMMVAGLVHSCALLTDGSAHCWGGNFAGQLGDGSGELRDRAEPAPVAFDGAFTAITSLGRHTCALARDGSLYCWGDDTDGQLGTGRARAACRLDRLSFFCSDQPERAGGPARWRAVSAGGSHTCAIDSSGALHCWGSNRYGQLGSPAHGTCHGPGGAAPCRREPAVVEGLDDPVSAVAAGASHTCALDESGRAFCWGLNTWRQTGTVAGDIIQRPEPVDTELRFNSLHTGAYHTCGVTFAGTLHCWGRDAAGELRGRARDGCAAGPCTARPVSLVSGSVAGAAAGFGLTCSRRADGLVRCWGSGEADARVVSPGGTEPGRSSRPLTFRRIVNEVRWRYAAARSWLRWTILHPLERAV